MDTVVKQSNHTKQSVITIYKLFSIEGLIPVLKLFKSSFCTYSGRNSSFGSKLSIYSSFVAGLQSVYGGVRYLSLVLHHQNFNYLCTPTDDGFIPRVSVNPDFSFAGVRKAVAEIKERLEEFGREELVKISKSGVAPTTDVQKRENIGSCISFNKWKCTVSCSE